MAPDARSLIAKRLIEDNLLSRVDRLERGYQGVVGSAHSIAGSLFNAGGSNRGGQTTRFGTTFYNIDPEDAIGSGSAPQVPLLSDVSPHMGLITAGEFRTGNLLAPGEGFSGVRIGYPGFTYNSVEWNIVGVENDVLQFGVRSSDGKALAGAGNVVLDIDGITLVAEDLTSTQIKWVNSGENILVSIGGYESGVSPNAVGNLVIAAAKEAGGTPVTPSHIDITAGELRFIQDNFASTGLGGPTGFSFVGGTHTGLPDTTEFSAVYFDLSGTVQWETGTIATQRAFYIFRPEYAFVGASTITKAVTFAISGSPVAGTNATITTSLSFEVESGFSRFADSHTTTTPQIILLQSSSGDAMSRFVLGTSRSYAMGIDNSDDDIFKWATTNSASAALGTTDLMFLDTTGRLGLNIKPGTDNYKLVVNFSGSTNNGVLVDDTVSTGSPNLFLVRKDSGTKFLVTGTATFVGDDLEIDGDLNHDGTEIGFFGVTPAARATTYSVTNLSTDRAYDANSTTTGELADVLGTLIADLRTYGLVT